MVLRTGHGAGAGQPRVEVLPPDEQPSAQAVGADPITAGRDSAGKVRTPEAARALAKMPRRSRHVPRRIALDPRFEVHNKRRLEWLKTRRCDHHAAQGGVSHGVGAMLVSAAWLYAAGECAAEIAAATFDVDLFKTAASLTSTARQHELAAWELGAREAQTRKANGGRAGNPILAAIEAAARGEEQDQ